MFPTFRASARFTRRRDAQLLIKLAESTDQLVSVSFGYGATPPHLHHLLGLKRASTSLDALANQRLKPDVALDGNAEIGSMKGR